MFVENFIYISTFYTTHTNPTLRTRDMEQVELWRNVFSDFNMDCKGKEGSTILSVGPLICESSTV
jgi:hypothetical protein